MVWDVELGVISREALIFHPATKAWVQVTRHPQLGTRFVSEEGTAEEIGLDFDLLSDAEIKGMAPKVPEQPAVPNAELVINTDIAIDAAEQLAAPPEVKPAEGLTIAGEFLTLKEPIPSLLEPEAPAVPIPPVDPCRSYPPRPPHAVPAMPADRAPRPSPTAYLPEPPPLDGELAPLSDENLDSTEYKPLEWKPEPRFRGPGAHRRGSGADPARVHRVLVRLAVVEQPPGSGAAGPGRARHRRAGRHRPRGAGRRFRVRPRPGPGDRATRRRRDGRDRVRARRRGPGDSFPVRSHGPSRGSAP